MTNPSTAFATSLARRDGSRPAPREPARRCRARVSLSIAAECHSETRRITWIAPPEIHGHVAHAVGTRAAAVAAAVFCLFARLRLGGAADAWPIVISQIDAFRQHTDKPWFTNGGHCEPRALLTDCNGARKSIVTALVVPVAEQTLASPAGVQVWIAGLVLEACGLAAVVDTGEVVRETAASNSRIAGTVQAAQGPASARLADVPRRV